MEEDSGAPGAHERAQRRRKFCFDEGMAVVYKEEMLPDEQPWRVGPAR